MGEMEEEDEDSTAAIDGQAFTHSAVEDVHNFISLPSSLIAPARPAQQPLFTLSCFLYCFIMFLSKFVLPYPFILCGAPSVLI